MNSTIFANNSIIVATINQFEKTISIINTKIKDYLEDNEDNSILEKLESLCKDASVQEIGLRLASEESYEFGDTEKEYIAQYIEQVRYQKQRFQEIISKITEHDYMLNSFKIRNFDSLIEDIDSVLCISGVLMREDGE